MKLTDNLISKYGADKLLHLLFGAWVVAEAKPYGILAMLLVVFLVSILSIIKERKYDANPDYGDVKATMYGMCISVLLYGFYTIIMNL